MKTSKKTLFLSLLGMMIFTLTGCFVRVDDVNPRGYEIQQEVRLRNFDGVEIGNAFKVNVRAGNSFSIYVRGDEVDLNDLDIYVNNGVLMAKYHNYRSRRYQVTFDIVMPSLRSIELYGASTGKAYGFDERDMYVNLSGSSYLDLNSDAQYFTFDISGASTMDLLGDTQKISGGVSGASLVNGFSFRSEEAYLDVSGASKVRVMASRYLNVVASGASSVYFRGTPVVDAKTSGGSVVRQD
jgi:hypothetical protein